MTKVKGDPVYHMNADENHYFMFLQPHLAILLTITAFLGLWVFDKPDCRACILKAAVNVCTASKPDHCNQLPAEDCRPGRALPQVQEEDEEGPLPAPPALPLHHDEPDNARFYDDDNNKVTVSLGHCHIPLYNIVCITVYLMLNIANIAY